MDLAGERLISVFGGTRAEDSSIAQLFKRLPRLVVSNPLDYNPSSQYNQQWDHCLERLLDDEGCAPPSGSSDFVVDVFQYETYDYLTVETNSTPIVLTLDLGNSKFRQLLKEHVKKGDKEALLLISLFSGIVLNVDSDLVGLVITRSKEEGPAFVYAVDAANQGPLYMSFYATTSSIKDILDGKVTGVVRWRINFFKSEIENTRVVLAGEAGEAVGARGKTYGEDLVQGKNIDHIRNFKKEDTLITQVDQICKPVVDFVSDDRSIRRTKTLVARLGGKLCVLFKAVGATQTERHSLLIMPRLRNSIGSKFCYTPALLSVAFDEHDEDNIFLPNCVLNREAQALTRNPKGTLSFCSLGSCVDHAVAVKVLKEDERFSFTNAKPGLNGFAAYFLGTAMYREMLQLLRLKTIVKVRMQDDLEPLAVDICKSLESSLKPPYMLILKALMYVSYISPKRLEPYTDFDESDISEELIRELMARKNFVDESEVTTERLKTYSLADDTFILSKVPSAHARKATRGAVSFMQVVAKSVSENARFESFINSQLYYEREEEKSSKRVKRDA